MPVETIMYTKLCHIIFNIVTIQELEIHYLGYTLATYFVHVNVEDLRMESM